MRIPSYIFIANKLGLACLAICRIMNGILSPGEMTHELFSPNIQTFKAIP